MSLSIAPEDPQSEIADVLERARADSAGSVHCLVIQYKQGDHLAYNHTDIPLSVLALMHSLIGKIIHERLAPCD